MYDILSFGEWVQERRNQLGYTRTVLAKQIGCAPITIKKIERDERRPTRELAALLAKVLLIPSLHQESFILFARGKITVEKKMELAEAIGKPAPQEFHGVYPYLVSPIDQNGNVKTDVLTRLCNDLIDAGVHGLTPLGSTGEFAYLSWEQRHRIVETVIKAAAGRVPVIAGVAATTSDEAARQAQAFETLGCDGILAILETYFPVSEDGVFGYFKQTAEAVSLPIVLYTNPNFQKANLSLTVIDRLSHIPNISYIKDASSNTGRLLSLINRVEGRMSIFAASAHIPASVMLIGGVGWMAGPANLLPKQSVQLYNLCRQKRWAEAMSLQRDLWQINQVFAKYRLAACVKGGLQMQGYDVGDPLLPQEPLSAAGKEDVRQLLIKLGGLSNNLGFG